MRLLVATTNGHKLAEIRGVLVELPIAIVSLDQFPDVTEAVEDGVTFEENARKKAVHYSRLTRHLTVAEDSGLEIAALDGAPGVLSARFNGDSYPEKFEAIRTQLASRGVTTSDARFVCALTVASGHDIVFETTGVVEGRLAPHAAGTGGFGYDPIFFYPPYGRTLAEVTAEQKAAVSHRGQAFRQLRQFLQTSERLSAV